MEHFVPCFIILHEYYWRSPLTVCDYLLDFLQLLSKAIGTLPTSIALHSEQKIEEIIQKLLFLEQKIFENLIATYTL